MIFRNYSNYDIDGWNTVYKEWKHAEFLFESPMTNHYNTEIVRNALLRNTITGSNLLKDLAECKYYPPCGSQEDLCDVLYGLLDHLLFKYERFQFYKYSTMMNTRLD